MNLPEDYMMPKSQLLIGPGGYVDVEEEDALALTADGFVALFELGPRPSRPAAPEPSQMFFCTTNSQPVWWNPRKRSWVNAMNIPA